MFLTVTPNPAVDRVFFVERFIPGAVLRTSGWVESVGGKGMDASVALRALGQEALALGFAAGETGQNLARLLDGYGIQTDLVWVPGETRLAHVIVERQAQRHTHLIAGGFAIPPEAFISLVERYLHRLPQAEWVLMGGSIPEGFPADGYRQLAALADRQHVPVLIDGSGAPARAAAEARPTILKMNRSEFRQTYGEFQGTPDGLLQAARSAQELDRLRTLVITGGEDGILALTEEGAYQATAPRQAVVNAAGAGDAASAALAWRLALGDGWAEALRWAAATSAAAVLTPGTAECRPEDIRRILPQVSVHALT